jgi:hypothetical protein
VRGTIGLAGIRDRFSIWYDYPQVIDAKCSVVYDGLVAERDSGIQFVSIGIGCGWDFSVCRAQPSSTSERVVRRGSS